jgi:hypothetical protein
MMIVRAYYFTVNREICVMKFAIIVACFASIALGACRREEPAPYYEPMKLGGNVHTTGAK